MKKSASFTFFIHRTICFIFSCTPLHISIQHFFWEVLSSIKKVFWLRFFPCKTQESMCQVYVEYLGECDVACSFHGSNLFIYKIELKSSQDKAISGRGLGWTTWWICGIPYKFHHSRSFPSLSGWELFSTFIYYNDLIFVYLLLYKAKITHHRFFICINNMKMFWENKETSNSVGSLMIIWRYILHSIIAISQGRWILNTYYRVLSFIYK